MSSKLDYSLSDKELEILRIGVSDPDYITGYFFKATDSDDPGFFFDNNFTEKGAWQKKLYRASQSNIVVIGGVGTGKTLGVGMAACAWALVTESFKFLNVAQKEWQARLMYDLILDRAEGTPFQKLILSAPQRPYPKIILRYRIGNVTYQSTLEFMSVDRDARGIFSWRGDWINVEEAGLLDNLDEIALNLSTRLTGATKRNRPFIGRLSFISNPWATPHLWYLFDLAASDPVNNLSIVVSTRDNLNVTKDQIKNMLKHIPEDERSRFLDGLRPEGKGNYFAKEAIYSCEDPVFPEIIENAVNEGKKGYYLSKFSAGVDHFQTPKVPGRMYFLVGDPGHGNAPARNAPCLMVWDVTDFPNTPMILVAFWWGQGNGKITPFISKLLEWKEYYMPFFTGIDSTGPQKSLAELVEIQFYDIISGDSDIIGLDFSGPRKPAYLVAGRLTLEGSFMRWPKFVTGIRAQLANYDPAEDRSGEPKIVQDIVCTLCMSAFAVRSYFGVDFNESIEDAIAENTISNSRALAAERADRSRRAENAR